MVVTNVNFDSVPQVRQKYGNMPFNLRHFEEETKARMGVVECVAHKMIEPFQVLYEKPGKLILLSKHPIVCAENYGLLNHMQYVQTLC